MFTAVTTANYQNYTVLVNNNLNATHRANMVEQPKLVTVHMHGRILYNLNTKG